MGSGSKRRSSDHVLIVPQRRSGAASGFGGTEAPLVCPLSFSVALEKNTTPGAALVLRKEEKDGIAVFLAGAKVAELDRQLTAQIGQCLEAGYRYKGIVVEKKNGHHYGEFTRTI